MFIQIEATSGYNYSYYALESTLATRNKAEVRINQIHLHRIYLTVRQTWAD